LDFYELVLPPKILYLLISIVIKQSKNYGADKINLIFHAWVYLRLFKTSEGLDNLVSIYAGAK
jgi:hypothetical protein